MMLDSCVVRDDNDALRDGRGQRMEKAAFAHDEVLIPATKGAAAGRVEAGSLQ
jgi:hypothetical protein